MKKTLYVTNEWKGHGKQSYYWNEYILNGKKVEKHKCHRFKFFDGDESIWEKESKLVESWDKKDSSLPDWLRKLL
jgi:hypothetical protein